jgi:thymidylate synthase (FAD)
LHKKKYFTIFLDNENKKMEKKARLIGYTQSITHPNRSLEDQVCYVARVSNPLNQSNTLNNRKLITYLLEHKHFSPFEMVSICLEILILLVTSVVKF